MDGRLGRRGLDRDARPATLARIDPKTNRVVATIDVAATNLGDPAVVGGKVWVPVDRREHGRDRRPGDEHASRARCAVGAGPVRRHRDRRRGLGAELEGRRRLAPPPLAAAREKMRAARKAALNPVTSLDFVEALPADRLAIDRRRVCESPTLARRFPVRSRGRASTSWYLRCPSYWKSPSTGPPPFRVAGTLASRSRRHTRIPARRARWVICADGAARRSTRVARVRVPHAG